MTHVNRKTAASALACALALGVGANLARADSVDLKYTGHVGHTAHIHYPNSQSANVYTGMYLFDASNATGNAGSLPDYGFCIDLNQEAPQNSSPTYQVGDLEDAPTPGTPMGAGKAGYITQLWAEHFNQDWATDHSSTNKTDASAFSLAVWELVAESFQSDASQYDVGDSSSKFYATDDASARSIANGWLHGLDANYTNNSGWDLVSLTNDDKQDYVTGTLGTPTTTVPVPTSWKLAMVLLTGFGAAGLKRRRRLA